MRTLLLILARADRPGTSVQVRDLENTRVVITHGYSYGDEFESNIKIQRIDGVADMPSVIGRFNAAHARLARNGAIAAIQKKWD